MRTLTNISAVSYSTFRFNAQLAAVTEFGSVAELENFHSDTTPVVLGEGSNTIFMQDLTAPVCRFVADSKTVTQLDPPHVLIHVEAGHNWHQLVSWAVGQQLWGIENLALIPGSVGAAPVQNIGAYGVELADCCLYVDFYHWQQRKVLRIAAGRCEFGYRDSVFKHALAGKGIIIAVGLCLSKQPAPVLGYKGLDHLPADADIKSIFEQVIAVRNSKLPAPAELANCGSFFKNPTVTPEQCADIIARDPKVVHYPMPDGSIKLAAGWLIDACGWKGKSVGNAAVYEKQALVLVNRGGATGGEVVTLAKAIQTSVYERFGIRLEPEPVVI